MSFDRTRSSGFASVTSETSGSTSFPASPAAEGPSLADGRPGGYDRIGAVTYANRYCGAAWGCGEDVQYHSGYWDYRLNIPVG